MLVPPMFAYIIERYSWRTAYVTWGLFHFYFFAGGIANAAAVSILGYMYDFSGSYRAVFWLLIALHLMGFLLLVILNHRRKSLI